METLQDYTDKFLAVLGDNWLTITVSSLLLLYSTFIDRIPESVLRLFDYSIYRLIIYFLILLIARSDPALAIVATIAAMVSIIALNNKKMNVREGIKFELIDQFPEKKVSSMAGVPPIAVLNDEKMFAGGFSNVKGYSKDYIKQSTNVRFNPQFTLPDGTFDTKQHKNKMVMDESKATAMMNKIEETKKMLQRNLTQEEVKQIGVQIDKDFEYDEGITPYPQNVYNDLNAINPPTTEDTPLLICSGRLKPNGTKVNQNVPGYNDLDAKQF